MNASRVVRMLQRAVLVLLVLAAGAYLALHSPLRAVIAQLVDLQSATCYFACSSPITVGQVTESASSLLLLAIAALAARASTQDLRGIPADRLLGFGLAWVAFVTVPAAFVAGAGQLIGAPLLRPPLGPLLAAIPSAVVLVVVAFSVGGPRTWERAGVRPSALLASLALVVAVLLAASLTVRLTHPTSSYDALSYHAPLSLLLWRGGDLASFLLLDPQYWSLAQPGVAELWAGLLGVIGGDAFADLSQVPFALLGAVAVAAIARRTGLPGRAAALAAAAYLITPLLAAQLGTRLNDVIAAGIFLAAAALLSAPPQGWSSGRIVLAALGLGLVTASKLALLPATAALGVVLFVGIKWPTGRRSTHRPPRRWRSVSILLAAAAAVFVLVILPWWVRNLAVYGNPLYPADLPLIGGGFDQTLLAAKDSEFVPFPLAWLIYPLFEAHSEYSGMGLLFVVALFGSLYVLLATKHRSRLAMPALVWAFTLPAWWLLTRHEPRFLLGPVGLLLAFAPWILVAVGRPLRPIAHAGFAAAAAASALITLVSAVAPLADDPTEPVAFYDTVWDVLPAAMTLPVSEGLLWEYGCAEMTYPALFPLLHPLPYEPPVRLVVPISCLASATSIAERMRQTGLRYAYVMVSPELRAQVQAKHPAPAFQVVAADTISKGRLAGTARYLYRLGAAP